MQCELKVKQIKVHLTGNALICIISFNENVIFVYVIYISFTDVIFKRLVCVFIIILENNVYYNDFFLYFYNLDFSEYTQITLFFFICLCCFW